MADPVWARDVVLTELRRRDRGGDGAAPMDDLREKCGIGATDLEVTLGVLVDEGSVVEEGDGSGFRLNAVEGEEAVPGEGPSPDADELLAEPGAAADVPERQPPDNGLPGSAPSPDLHSPGFQMLPHAVAPIMDGGDVRLTRGMIDGLSNETLGELVKAGLADRTEGRFVVVIE